MARTVQKPQEQPRGRGPGRPPANPANAQQDALDRLQLAMDKATDALCDGSTSVAKRAAMAARRGIPINVAKDALATIKEAFTDLEISVEAAYAAPRERPARESRKQLSL